MRFHVLLQKGRDLWKEIEGDASNVNGFGPCPSQLQLTVEGGEMDSGVWGTERYALCNVPPESGTVSLWSPGLSSEL